MYVYVGTHENKLVAAEIHSENGQLLKIIQTIDNVVDPLPNNTVQHNTMKDTEWVLVHPKYPILYTFTSFWNAAHAHLTTFRIEESSGKLQKLGSPLSTGGKQAAHAVFSKDGTTLVISHHNDGNLSFFDCSKEDAPPTLIRTMETPTILPPVSFSLLLQVMSVPSLHHAIYSSDVKHNNNPKYLLTCDASKQDCIWTYPIHNDAGRASKDTPYRNHLPAQSQPSCFSKILQTMLGLGSRIRRVAIHPNGKYCYLLYELHNVIQVYPISPDGKIDSNSLLQIVPTIDDKGSSWGLYCNAAAELMATSEGVWVSNRGMNIMGRKAENSVRFFAYEQDGAQLILQDILVTAGPVRHFLLNEDEGKLWTGTNAAQPGSIELFMKNQTNYQKVGEATIGVDILGMAKY